MWEITCTVDAFGRLHASQEGGHKPHKNGGSECYVALKSKPQHKTHSRKSVKSNSKSRS